MKPFFLFLLLCLGVAAWGGSYFCPMRCEGKKTYQSPGTCPKCGMTLEERLADAAVMNSRDYRVDLKSDGKPHAGTPVKLTFSIRKTADNSPVQEFEYAHERALHLYVVSQDMTVFAHEHPSASGEGEFSMNLGFPVGGNYVFFAEFTPKGRAAQVIPVALQVDGEKRPAPRLSDTTKSAVNFDGYQFKLKVSPKAVAGKTTRLTFRFLHDGKPLKDLALYQGEQGQLAIVSADLTRLVPNHPITASPTPQFGPTVTFAAVFPKPGMYRLWGHFNHRGRILVVPFNLKVR